VTYTAEELADVIRDARAKMNQTGRHWCQGASIQPLGEDAPGEFAYCSWGSVYYSSRGEGGGDYDIGMAVMGELAKDPAVAPYPVRVDVDVEGPLEEAYSKVVGFNDDPARTWEEIDGVFRRTEERLRSEV
jgi:hypothetical protein